MKRALGKLSLLAAAVATILITGGCGSEPHQMDANRYANDGYLGMSNSNPNFRMNPTHHTYSKDRQLMRQALRRLNLDQQSTIFMNGDNVTITIHMQGLDPQEAEAIRSGAYMELKGNVPRYDYKIRFDGS